MPAFPSSQFVTVDASRLSFSDALLNISSESNSSCANFMYTIVTQTNASSRHSESLSVQVGLEPPPVTSLRANSTSPNQIVVSWAAPQFASCQIRKYEVWREGQLADTRVCCDGPQTQFIDDDLDGNTEYSYKVRALSYYTGRVRNSPATVNATTQTGTPGEPASLSARNTSEYIVLSWRPPADPNGEILNYTVTRDQSLIGGSGQHTNFSESLRGLQGAWRYVYTVTAHTSAGPGLPAVVIVLTPPKAPAAPRFVYITVVGNTSVVISWVPAVYHEDVEMYKVNIRSPADGKMALRCT